MTTKTRKEQESADTTRAGLLSVCHWEPSPCTMEDQEMQLKVRRGKYQLYKLALACHLPHCHLAAMLVVVSPP